ncbi:hypothetical protein P7H20_00005, partial [Paenibacillus larvae]
PQLQNHRLQRLFEFMQRPIIHFIMDGDLYHHGKLVQSMIGFCDSSIGKIFFGGFQKNGECLISASSHPQVFLDFFQRNVSHSHHPPYFA